MATITKKADMMFEGNHPNNINPGYTQTIPGPIVKKPVVGERFSFGSLLTSKVKEIIMDDFDRVVFETENSIYIITP